MTIDQMIVQLQNAKSNSKLDGNTVVFVCVEDRPYIEVSGVKLDSDNDGACCLVMLSWQP